MWVIIACGFTSLGECDRVMTVFNTATADSGPLTLCAFEIFKDWFDDMDAKGYTPAVFDENGDQIAFEIIETERDVCPYPAAQKIHGDNPLYARAENGYLPFYRLRILLNASVPALGYRSFAVRFVKKRELASANANIFVDKSNSVIENECLRVRLRDDGLIDMLDKASGREFAGLHALEDCGDAGQGWDHLFPENDIVIRTTDPGAVRGVRVKVAMQGALSAVGEISYTLRVPDGLAPGRKSRAERTAALKVRIRCKLDAGSRRLDFETNITNNAHCHRVRALFPTGIDAQSWFADSAFDIVERQIKLPGSEGWAEQPREETPIKNFAAIQDAADGFAVITKGLCEASAIDDSRRTLALTLFRAFEQQIGEGWTRDSQLLGDIRLNYSIMPYAADGFAPVRLFDETERYKSPVASITRSANSGALPTSGRMLGLPDGLALSTIKTAESGRAIVARAFNPSDAAINGAVSDSLGFESGNAANLLEQPSGALKRGADGFEIEVGPKKIATILLS